MDFLRFRHSGLVCTFTITTIVHRFYLCPLIPLYLFRMIAPALFVGGSIMFFGFIQDFRYTYKTAIQTNFQEEPYVPLENVAYEDNTR
jgi:hypothetical protein